MKKSTLFLSLIMACITVSSQVNSGQHSELKDVSYDSKSTSVPFYTGMNGYYAYRIPTLIKTKKTILAFAEARKNSTSDFGDIDIVLRRSENNGKSWKPLQRIFDLDTMAVQNPVPIYIKSEQKIVLLFNTTSLSEHDILNKDYKEEHQRRAFITTSYDEGASWSVPREITQMVKLPHWRWHALGPVHGIVLQNPANRGRLVVPVAISTAKGNTAYCMALIFSDDNGATWNIGAVDTNLKDKVQCNETTIVELLDGGIYVNTRDHLGGSLLKNRGETFSRDGGLSFEQPIVESEKFPSPIVQSALLRWRKKNGKFDDLVLFSTPSNPKKREHLIVMTSIDECQTWQQAFKVHHGFSAYSDMVQINKNTLGILYETDDYKKIRFRRLNLKKP